MNENSGKRYGTDLRVPIIFSVTGHRDIPEDEGKELEEKISSLFNEFKQRYRNTDLILITPLADGGDRIAAHAAIKCNVNVAPILPSKKENYMRTFGDPNDNDSVIASVKEFEDILNDKGTYTPYELSDIDVTGNDAGDAYRALSSYMIANSHVIIALWDGNRYGGRASAGGAYDTVKMAYRGIDHTSRYTAQLADNNKCYSPERYLDVTEDCLVYYVKTERKLSDDEKRRKGFILSDDPLPFGTSGYIVPDMISEDVEKAQSANVKRSFFKAEKNVIDEREQYTVRIDNDATDSGDDVKLYNDLPKYYNKIFSRINEMNFDILQQKAKNASVKTTDKKRITEKEKENGTYGYMFGKLSDDVKNNGCVNDSMSRMMITDDLAMEYQRASFINVKLALILSIAATFFLQIFILLGRDVLLISLYSIFLITATLHFRSHKKSRRFLKFIEYRLLAESMRVGCYWDLVGIKESVTSSCYGYMKNNMMWIRGVLTAWESHFLNDHSKAEELNENAEKDIGTAWIDGQERYHHGKKGKNSRKANLMTKVGNHLNTILIVLAVTVLMFGLTSAGKAIVAIFHEFAINGFVLVSSLKITGFAVLQLFIIGLTTILLIVTGIKDKLIHGGTDGQIEAKYLMFHIAHKRLRIIEKDEELIEKDDARRKIYYELGVQCINEVNDWAFEHIAKDANVPRK
ncbi:MAG: hypothetical protein FWD37_05400 [Methanomassiliicoccaceae archaeon]|nr:hypothetical protein [Methanomassiliicoccaceae archaeon]